jgi:protein-S-isoprenylcysteine O-methyltransferase Ste14
MDRLFKLIYFAGLLAEIVIRTPYDRQRRKLPKVDQRITSTEWFVLNVLLLGLLVPMVYSFTPWLSFANYPWSEGTKKRAGVLGSVLLALALWLFWRSHRDLGSNWSPSLEVNSEQTLITRGVYRSIRHPMYASQFILSAAQPLLLQNWVAGFAGLLTFLPLYLLRVPREEQMMRDHFGAAYEAYCARTGRIVPWIKG